MIPDENSLHQPSPALPLVQLEDISLTLGKRRIFSGLTLSLYPGTHTALIGPNGSGKSTLIRLIQGDLRLPQYTGDATTGGSILWAFADEADPSALLAKKYVRLVSPLQQQTYTRMGWHISGEEILLSGLDNAAMVYGEVSTRHYERATSLAEAAGAAYLMEMHAPAMSQGQLRLCLILRALMGSPALLLLDEPFDSLDHEAREHVQTALRLAVARGVTTLISAHRREDVPDFATHMLILRGGKAHSLAVDTPGLEAELAGAFDQHAHDAMFSDEETLDVLAAQCVELHSARPADAQPASTVPFVRALKERVAPLLQLSHVDVFIDRTHVLHDIHWIVQPGEHWLLSGPNGSGKSTLLRLLYGEEFAAFGGSLLWCGQERPPLDDLRLGIGYVSDRLQESYAYDITALEFVISGLHGSIGLYHEPTPYERCTAMLWLDRLGLIAFRDAPYSSLSSGMARRVLLARALAASPPVLLLDEPCSGLDAPGRQLFFSALPMLAAQGVTLIHVSHHEHDWAPLFTHELRLEHGRVAFSGLRRDNPPAC